MIVGFVGLMGVGKTTACNILKKHWGEDVVHINFKDGLVAEMRERVPDVLEELAFIYDRSVDELFATKPPAMRALMQNYGTEVRRRDQQNYWVEKWQESVRKADRNVVCDDVRFVNEADAVERFAEGFLIRLVRTDIVHTGNHQSETEQSTIEVDHTITLGEGEQDKLEEELLAIIRRHTPLVL